MLSIEALRKSLGSHAAEYLEEELITMRRDMYQFAYFAYDFYYHNKINDKNN